MSYFYTIVYLMILSSSVFAMDNKEKDSKSYHMTGQVSKPDCKANDEKANLTFKYPDSSKSTYYYYKDSSKDKK